MRERHHGRRAVLLAIAVLFGVTALAGDGTSDIDDHRFCEFCGMDRKAYGFSRMLIRYEDGAETGVCSLHCAVIELESHKDRAVKALFIADRGDRTLTPAESAVWVMGGTKRGVMTQRPKWAFRSRPVAEAFIARYGGQIATWPEALAAAREDLGRERK
jgi:nitrous oxide reductase accessory protein NosL